LHRDVVGAGGGGAEKRKRKKDAHQKLSRKRIRAARSAGGMVTTRLRAACASPPCHRIASMRLRAGPSCRNCAWPLTCWVSPMPHSGAVRHSVPVPRAGAPTPAQPEILAAIRAAF
jgi:hypothetical protein